MGKSRKCFIALFIFLLSFQFGKTQFPYGLFDGRDGDLRCETCEKVINEKPHEVLFGIDIHQNGEVFFSMNNKQWFEKLFASATSGITADIVSKDRYDCKKDLPETVELPKGYVLPPLYKKDFGKNMTELTDGHILIKIGVIPSRLMKKELEGNLLIVNGAAICYYSNFLNIDRSVWDLLPMGLFADTLISRESSETEGQTTFFTYTRKIQAIIPFDKGKTTFNINDIRPLYDSLELNDFKIRKIEIRAYSSVEGPEKINISLVKGRADAIIKALQKLQPGMERIKIITAENWLEFYRDIESSEFDYLLSLSKNEIKRKLLDKAISDKLEPILAGHRKAVITVYLEPETEAGNIADSDIVSSFDKAIADKDLKKARIILREMATRINDNKLPAEYLNHLEVPFSKDYLSVLNDKEIYRYMLKNTSEYEALEHFLELKKIAPENGRVNYNICALRFFVWQFGGSVDSKSFLQDINLLEKQGIDSSLTKRMLINYHILKCMEDMDALDYDAKDKSLLFIREIYPPLSLSDDELFSLAKYFSFYSHKEWAEELIEPRIGEIDVSEDLVFYYVNLGFYHPYEYGSEQFQHALQNAANLNRPRFCKFFKSIDWGGASMQLLEYDDLKKIYCQSCP